MTNLEVIRNMSERELAFFLCTIEMNDPNSIPNIDEDDVQYNIDYLNKDGKGLLELFKYFHESPDYIL